MARATTDHVVTFRRPHADQLMVKRQAKRFNTLLCGRRWGKTTMLEELAALPALHGHPVGYFAPRYKLLSDFWRSICKRLAPVTVERREDERRLELIGGGVLEAWTLEDPDAGRSRRYKRLIIDEAGLVRDLRNKWSGSLRPTLADLAGDAWLAGTPKGLGTDLEWFFKRAETSPQLWASWQRSTDHNPHIAPEEVLAMREELGDLFAAQEVDAQFVDTGNAERFLPHPAMWHSCQYDVTPMPNQFSSPQVLALDAAVSGDTFAAVAVSRHPLADDVVVERWTKLWKAVDFDGGTIDYRTVEADIVDYLNRHNVVQVTYDPYQAHYLATRLSDYVWTDAFNQGSDRLEADRQLLDLIVNRRLRHSGSEELTGHILNAYRKVDSDGRRLRLVKGSVEQKIDAAVALSMAASRCLSLNLF